MCNCVIEGCVFNLLVIEYYQQCVSVGLIIVEVIQISLMGQGYLDIFGIYSQVQIEVWCGVIVVVYVCGGWIVLQFWYVGCILYISLLFDGQVLVVFSVFIVNVKMFIVNGFEDVLVLCVLVFDEIFGIIQDYCQVVCNVIIVGFDGVEVYVVNGYLIDQFLCDGSNQCIDVYGGSIENCICLLDEVVCVVVVEIGVECIGVCLLLVIFVNDVYDSQLQLLFECVVECLDVIGGLVFIYVIEGVIGGLCDNIVFDYVMLCVKFCGLWIVNNGYIKDIVLVVIVFGYVDMIVFGCVFIVNLDLVECLWLGVVLFELDLNMLYGGGLQGYIDYLSVFG